MKLVLSGYYGFHNVGDEAILLSIISALRQEQPDIEIIVLSNDPSYTKKTYQVDAVNRWSLKEVIKAIRGADGLISGGGSLLQDQTGAKSVPYYAGVMMIATMLGKPVFVYAQGIGPIHRALNEKAIKIVMDKVDYVSVRDEDSKKLLQRIGVTREVALVPDPVIGFQQTIEDTWLEGQGIVGEVITISVRDWQSKQPFKEKVAEALDEVSAAGHHVVFVPMHGEHDQKTSEEVASMMKQSSAIFPYDATIEEKIAVIAKSSLLVGMRLHALIFAGVSNTPMIGISYDPKIDSFLDQANQPKIGHVDDAWTGKELAAMILRQLKKKEKETEKVASAMEPLKIQANHTAKTVLDMLKEK